MRQIQAWLWQNCLARHKFPGELAGNDMVEDEAETMNAQALLDRFAVYGHFYARPIAGVDESLRDRLEIVDKEILLNAALQKEPDLLVVMMNPGASRPLESLWDSGQTQQFVSAQPDRTQYQIMRLMLVAQKKGLSWRHARILNLSDLRTPKSAIFAEKLHRYGADDSHSLFSGARHAECEALFSVKSTPVLFGWGLGRHLLPLASRALAVAAGHPVLGLTADGALFRHPLPQRHDFQLQWLEQVGAQVAVLAKQHT